MYIPLDHLYHWISSKADRPVNIYYFYPHGSKNLWDVANYPAQKTLYDRKRYQFIPDIICHDQEPLNFDFYQQVSCDDFIRHRDPLNQNFLCFSLDDSIQNLKLAIHANNTTVYDTPILLHSEQNSQDVTQYSNNGYIPVHYWAHAVIARDWFRFMNLDERLVSDRNPTCDFLIYSRGWSGTREYRLKFLESLIKCDLHKTSRCYFDSFSTGDLHSYPYFTHVFENKSFQIQHTELEKFYLKSTGTSNSSADYTVDDIVSTRLSVVLETVFDTTKIHLTEKVCRSLASGHPFILASGPFSLSYLKNYGFKTFEPWIDESYDNEPNSSRRLEKIIAAMKKFSDTAVEQKNYISNQLQKVAKFNQQHFFSQQFADKLTSEIATGLADALKTVQKTKAQYWLRKRKKLKLFFPHKSYYRYTGMDRDLKMIRNLRNWQ
jgi:hypothetical protein